LLLYIDVIIYRTIISVTIQIKIHGQEEIITIIPTSSKLSRKISPAEHSYKLL